MKNIKTILLFVLLLTALIFVPTLSKAATHDVQDETELKAALQTAENYDIINLTDNIALTSPIEIIDKDITIEGNDFAISKASEGWQPSANNGTLITAGAGATVTLSNLTLRDSQKYGAQAYNSGHLILDGVTVLNNAYGGILSNAGTVEIKDLNLGKNGTGANNGIEIAKADGLEGTPRIIMNGTLTSTENDNVIYIATNNPSLTEFDVENAEGTQDKIYTSGNRVVITDENNEVLFQSNENSDVTTDGDTFVPNVIVTVKLLDKITTLSLQSGTTLTKANLEEEIDLEELGLADYKIVDYYSDEEYETLFNFETALTENTTIYAKLETINQDVTPDDNNNDNNNDNDNNNNDNTNTAPSDTNNNDNNDKDTTPKTGVESNLGLAIFAIVFSSVAITVLRRKEEN